MQNNNDNKVKPYHSDGKDDGSSIRVLAFLEAKEGKRQDLLDILIPIIEHSRKEEGNVIYTLNYSVDHPNKLVFDEVWSNMASFNKHYQSSYSEENRNKIKDLLISPMTIKLFKEISK